MDLLSKLPFLKGDPEVEDTRTDEEIAEQAKKDRIKFHRESVRNGPVKFKTVTAGQERRAQKRALARQKKNNYRSQVRSYLETRRLASITAGKLREAGALPYVDVRWPVDRVQQVLATAWIVQRFGVEDEDGETSYALDDVVAALNAALKFYGQAYNFGEQALPEGYIVPLYTEASA